MSPELNGKKTSKNQPERVQTGQGKIVLFPERVQTWRQWKIFFCRERERERERESQIWS